MEPLWKNRNSNEQYCLHIKTEKNINFLLINLPLQHIVSISNVYYMEFYRNLLFEYSLKGIVKPKFTRRNEMMQNFGNSRSVQKCAQNAGSNVLK